MARIQKSTPANMLGLIGNTPQIHHFHYDISWLNDIFSWYTPPRFFWTPQKNGCSIHIFAGKINRGLRASCLHFLAGWLISSGRLLSESHFSPGEHGQSLVHHKNNLLLIWLVAYLLLWKIMELGWWHPIYEMESHKIPWFQTTNQFWLFSIYSKKLEDWTTHPVGWGWFNHHLVR